LNFGKVLLLEKQAQVHAEKTAWGGHGSDTKTTRRNVKCHQWPLLAVYARSMSYCIRKLQMFTE